MSELVYRDNHIVCACKTYTIINLFAYTYFAHTCAECEYASKRRKPIVPLLLQHRYDPDGWLGIIKGTKLHFDFSVEEKFEPSLQGLLREIANMS